MRLGDQKHKESKIFTRRAFVVGGLQLAFLGVLTGRLAWLQIVEAGRYKTLSDKNRINIKLVPPSRGQIVDRFGIPLAVNKQNFRVQLIPEQTGNMHQVLRKLQKIIDLSDKSIEQVLKKAEKQAKFLPIEIKDDLSWEEVARIEVNLPDLSGLAITEGDVRSYPYGEATAHVIGYVGLAHKAEVHKNPLYSLPGFKLGRVGIEKELDKALQGRPGRAEVEVNVVGREVREIKRQPSIEGSQVTLSIDIRTQNYLQQQLAQHKSASAVLMNAHTGAVYSMASHPSYDPNLFTYGLSADEWEALLAQPGYPLTNKAISGQYPPASTFKMITALAGLQLGIIDSKRRVYCPGYFEYGGDRFHCWKHQGHGWVDLNHALAESCDTYFYEIAPDIGIDNIAAASRLLGLGQKYGFDLAEERPGLVPDKNWKMGYHGQGWKQGETVVASIGQGYLQATPMQLAVMTARLINGGKAVKPWLVAYLDNHFRAGTQWPSLGLAQNHLGLIREGMDMTVNHKDGTAYQARIKDERYAMGGKTGTAQVKKISREQRMLGIKNEDLPWEQRHHALFVGYAPLTNPEYVCAVVVEHGGSGSSVAAPIARDLLLFAQKRGLNKSQYHLERSS